jgi:hypothetical protein
LPAILPRSLEILWWCYFFGWLFLYASRLRELRDALWSQTQILWSDQLPNSVFTFLPHQLLLTAALVLLSRCLYLNYRRHENLAQVRKTRG